jgi:DNA-binding response OmpR family regulator
MMCAISSYPNSPWVRFTPVPQTIANLLIVEDDPDVAEMLATFFSGKGYQVVTAGSGEEGVAACHAHQTDLVILDIRLPDIDGYEVARRLRHNRRMDEIPIIFLTDKRERADRLHGLELGADDYITKPFDFQELHLRVHNALQRTTQQPLSNRVTDLPQGGLVDERLEACLSSEGWVILSITVENLDAFQESYGFIAAEDAMRAIGLIISGAAGKQDFTGHLSDTHLIVVSDQDDLPVLKESIQKLLEEKIDYFYPLNDIHHPSVSVRRLSVRVTGLLAAQGPFKSLTDLKERLLKED